MKDARQDAHEPPEDLTQYAPILLAAGIRAPLAKLTPQGSPASKATLRMYRGDSLLFGKRDRRPK